MQFFPSTIFLRHRKENLKKCSLKGLESRTDCQFFSYPTAKLPDLTHYVLLTIEAPPLTIEDQDRGLLFLDATWRLADKMLTWVESQVIVEKRSIPLGFKTAYPRCQEDDRGLATLEALFIAYTILGRETKGLLDQYYWREPFLVQNQLTVV